VITYVGGMSVGDAVPGAVDAAAAGAAGINAAIPDIQARLDSLLAFAPVNVDFAAQLSLAQATLASIQAGISLGLPVPSLAAQIAQVAALVAELLAAITSINAQLSIITALQAHFGAAGLHVYAYTGQVGDLSAELYLELEGGVPGGSPTDAANGLLLLTTVPATWAALAQILKVTP
jgi:hypothetical protein